MSGKALEVFVSILTGLERPVQQWGWVKEEEEEDVSILTGLERPVQRARQVG